MSPSLFEDDARATGKPHRSGSGGQGRKSKKRCASSAEEDEFEYTTAPPVKLYFICILLFISQVQ